MPDLFAADGVLEEPSVRGDGAGRRVATGLRPALRELDCSGRSTIIRSKAPFRHMSDTLGRGDVCCDDQLRRRGWLTDRTGYRYDRIDPESGRPWPVMPDCFQVLAREAAKDAGYLDFVPDACRSTVTSPARRLTLPSGQKRARLRAADRLRVAGTLRPSSSSAGLKTERSRAEIHGSARRCRGVGRPFTALRPRRDRAEGRPARFLARLRINLTFRRAL